MWRRKRNRGRACALVLVQPSFRSSFVVAWRRRRKGRRRRRRRR